MSSNSLEQYRKERAEATAPPRPVEAERVRRDPTYAQTRERYGTVDEYMRQRQRHAEDLRSRSPEVYHYSRDMSPNYGMYDSNFLMGLMLGSLGSNSSNAAWLESQRNQEWYRQWRADMDRRAANDAELRSKIASMEQEMARQRSYGNTPQVGSLPAGVPNSLAIAPEAMIAAEDAANSSVSWSWTGWLLMALATLLIATVGLLIYLHQQGARSNRRSYSH